MTKIKKDRTKIIIPIFLLFAIMVVGFIYLFNRDQLQDIRSRAEDDNSKFCLDNCKPEGKSCDLTSPGTDECCREIKKTGDPLTCPWPQRGYCSIDECASIPAGINRQKCGGPRHSWCGECQTHKCPGYTNSISAPPPVVPTSISTLQTEITSPPFEGPPPTLSIPTTIPQPTNPYIPTQGAQPVRPRPQITYIPLVYPTGSPPPSLPPVTTVPAKSPFKITLPNFLPAKESVEAFIQKTKFSLQDFLSKILP